MLTAQKRTTSYFDVEVHQELRRGSIETGRSHSDLVNEAVRLALDDDADDLAACEERFAEKNLPFERVVKDLERRGRI